VQVRRPDGSVHQFLLHKPEDVALGKQGGVSSGPTPSIVPLRPGEEVVSVTATLAVFKGRNLLVPIGPQMKASFVTGKVTYGRGLPF
jgi:hypothetical protein